jgi:formamidopyrimidine-DNA glycosylase
VPELPEVQTVVNHLLPIIKDKRIISFKLLWNNTLYSKNITFLSKTIKNKKIVNVFRIGKYIIIELDVNYIAFHLRMTGYLYNCTNIKDNKYLRCYFKFSDSSYLAFQDIRKFGGFYYIENLDIIYKKIGLDPFDSKFNSSWLKKNLKIKKRKIKGLLLDQSFISGLGNIYIDEILWASKIHPNTLSNMLNSKDIDYLSKNTKSILKKSINHHGTTIINFTFDNMKTGSYKNELMVYGRNNEKCFRCNNIIIKIKVFGRGTYFCKICQTIRN